MKAIYYEQFQGAVEVREVPDPKISESSVIVKVEAFGLCLIDSQEMLTA